MDENARKCRELTSLLRPGINGAVAEAMQHRGITYKVSWGVSLPMIRAVAARYAPDHGLALFLAGHFLRELRLSAYVIADPSQVTEEELDFWGATAVNPELAENLAFSLISRTSLGDAIAEKWLAPDNSDMLIYSALLALGRMKAAGKLGAGTDLGNIAVRYSRHDNSLVSGAAQNILARL